MRQPRLAIFILTVILSVGSYSRITAGDRIEMPQGVFYYQPAASVFGTEAAWINPAALARYRIAGFQFMADYFEGKYGKNWGSVVGREGLALAYRRIYSPDSEDYVDYTLAGAVRVGREISVGGSYQYFKQGKGIFDNRHFWNLGLGFHPQGHFRFGAVFSNLNRGKIDDERTETEQRYSVSWRPNKYDLTVSVDMFLSTKTRLSNADYVYHAEFSPTKGLYINGFVDSDKNFQVGVRANLHQYFVGARRSANRNADHRGSTVFFGATNARQPSMVQDKVRRLSIGLEGQPQENPPQPVFGRKATPYVTTLLNIYRAADDPSIGEMVITLHRISMAMGQAQELYEALSYFRSQGKAITCHISHPNNIAYYIGSACNQVLIPPVSQLNLVGLRAELTFYAGTLEKLGVKADIIRIGEYKTATERYTHRSASEENRQQVNRLLDDLFDQFVTGIAGGRNLSADSVRSLIDNGPFTSEEALQYGLVDGLSYKDELKTDFLSKMPEISFHRYLTDTVVNDTWSHCPKLAVVVADGEVAFDEGGLGPFADPTDATPGKMNRAFRHAARDREIRGIVFRINSPGGLALAGEEILHAAHKVARKKPLVVSMANVAASGGYYIAMPAGYVIADPATITGSIGIYGGKLDLSGLYQKLEVGKELYTRGKYAGLLTNMRPFTSQEREKYASQMEAFYNHFLTLVSDNRKLPVDSVDNLARGKVFTGREAVRIGLVDQLGGIKTALDITAGQLGIEDYTVELLPRKRPWFLLPGGSLLKTVSSLFRLGGTDSELTDQVADGVSLDGIMARLPYDITIE